MIRGNKRPDPPLSDPENNKPGEPPGPSDIRPVSILDEMKRSYLDYAMSVIVARALPDARDGLKPVHRRILYSMYEQGHTPDKKYVKSARVVGDVIGKYHPHGDQSIYDAMVRMAQLFSMRVPLIDGQGNFGSVDGDPPAAYRYTEARLSEAALEVLGDIDKDTVDFQPDYDNAATEPSVLPAKFPNLLVNGAGGIAVGMATNIPPHNLGEVIDACVALIENPALSIDDLINIIPGPDFPTGGIILGRQGIRSAYHLGRGSIVMRGKVSIDTIRKDREAIIISEIPYQVNKARDRAHILVGLAIAVANIDEIIRVIRTSPDPNTARETLMSRVWPAKDVAAMITLIDDPRHTLAEDGTARLSMEQAKAILELRLARLTALGREEISEELDKLAMEIADYLDILRSRARVQTIIKEELAAVKSEFATPRKTVIIEHENEVEDEDLIQREDMVVTVSHAGYVKRVPLSTYRAQRRGGKGRAGMQTRDED